MVEASNFSGDSCSIDPADSAGVDPAGAHFCLDSRITPDAGYSS